MKHFKYLVSLVMVLALALVFIGCSKPPDEEKSAAKAAMDAAAAKGADKYAATDFKAAKGLWDKSEAQLKEKKYSEAKQGYLDAKAAFQKAAAAVEAGKKAVTAEVTAAVAALEDSWKSLGASAKKLKKKMKDKKDAWAADAKAFEEKLKAAKDTITADPAGAKTKTGELKAIVEKWEAAFKELAAAPAKPEKKKKK
jgi:PBP1b-binding outer membrane lipoprotein LpoB